MQEVQSCACKKPELQTQRTEGRGQKNQGVGIPNIAPIRLQPIFCSSVYKAGSIYLRCFFASDLADLR